MGNEWQGRITFLERRVSELEVENATHKEEKALFFNEIDRLKADNAKLKKALRDFGRHIPGCSGSYAEYLCKCGLTDFLKEEDLA